ncbi:sec-independent protein translocase protein TatC [Pullulanibacillus pueri]|uniref:Sec-independent protein translocase protein TatC n=1 Tax=Pullulanibacillus pueri TaxID=1437324 RepID=A0A8J3EL77_9BACL|nr:twin-arginine translocase subunit TatC [Pullulanibacillus pueri]MBM7681256.1 sec-independent protein translocase protein TatC [Pullulanibacillus pueri]GGH77859.1 Sec-independent protein translocase protein TatCd [Pullulanibacillus pueri]
MSEDVLSTTEADQTVIEHVSELRKVLLISGGVFVLVFCLSLFTLPKIVPFLTRGYDVVLLGPQDVIRFYAGVAGVLGIALTLPVLSYLLWRFIKPALTQTESRVALTYIPFIFISFAVGVAFGYFTVFPIVFHFLMNLGEMSFKMVVTARQYFSFLMTLTLALGLLFELPMTMMFLTSLGLVSPTKLKKMRKSAYLILAIISAIMTPPDFISQLIVLVPLVFLYELGVVLSTVSFKKKLKRELQLT